MHILCSRYVHLEPAFSWLHRDRHFFTILGVKIHRHLNFKKKILRDNPPSWKKTPKCYTKFDHCLLLSWLENRVENSPNSSLQKVVIVSPLFLGLDQTTFFHLTFMKWVQNAVLRLQISTKNLVKCCHDYYDLWQD